MIMKGTLCLSSKLNLYYVLKTHIPMAKLPVMNVLSAICEDTFGSKLQAFNEIQNHKLTVSNQGT